MLVSFPFPSFCLEAVMRLDLQPKATNWMDLQRRARPPLLFSRGKSLYQSLSQEGKHAPVSGTREAMRGLQACRIAELQCRLHAGSVPRKGLTGYSIQTDVIICRESLFISQAIFLPVVVQSGYIRAKD